MVAESQAASRAVTEAVADADQVADGLYGRMERLAFVAGALIMLGILAGSAWLAIRNEQALGHAARSQEMRALTVDLLEALTSAETGQRGYLLTGKDAYLAPYENAVRTIPALLGRLSPGMSPGNGDFAAWRGVIADKMAELGQTVQLVRAGRRPEALAIVQSDRGQRDMDAARDLARRLTEIQHEVLKVDLARSQNNARGLVAVDSAAFVLLVLLVGFVTSRGNRYVAGLSRARSALQAANAELGRGRERLEAAVLERTAELTAANEEIQRFAYIVSHDLRAPLLNIIGFTSELEAATSTLNRFVAAHIERQDSPIPADVLAASREDLPEAIRFIQTSTAKMDRLIGAILRLSREGRRVLTPEKLDMAALLGGVIDSLRHQAEAGGARIEVGAVPGIVCDRIAIEQVFSNLVDNALKYLVSGRPGVVTIDGALEPAPTPGSEGMWGRAKPMLRYSVADNGRGIAERDRARVFELFRRAGVQDRPGEGIGLAHVQALVRRLGGTIECRSVLGCGSTFTVRLPSVLAYGGAETE